MTQEEFAVITKLYTSFWNESFDNFRIKTWYEVFKDFKAQGLYKSIMEMSKENKYPPRISDIVEKYDQLRNGQIKEQEEKSKNEIKRLTAGQETCVMCDNTGFVSFEKNGYLYFNRCECPHGRDLSRFSRPQQDKTVKPKDEKLGDIYIPTVREVLGDEEYAILKARKVTAAAEIKEQARERKVTA